MAFEQLTRALGQHGLAASHPANGAGADDFIHELGSRRPGGVGWQQAGFVIVSLGGEIGIFGGQFEGVAVTAQSVIAEDAEGHVIVAAPANPRGGGGAETLTLFEQPLASSHGGLEAGLGIGSFLQGHQQGAGALVLIPGKVQDGLTHLLILKCKVIVGRFDVEFELFDFSGGFQPFTCNRGNRVADCEPEAGGRVRVS